MYLDEPLRHYCRQRWLQGKRERAREREREREREIILSQNKSHPEVKAHKERGAETAFEGWIDCFEVRLEEKMAFSCEGGCPRGLAQNQHVWTQLSASEGLQQRRSRRAHTHTHTHTHTLSLKQELLKALHVIILILICPSAKGKRTHQT